jgi:predicted ArsR family transcriptional regulator
MFMESSSDVSPAGEVPTETVIAAVGALDDPARLALFRLVARSAEPVSREEAAGAMGMSRSTAAFHLDRLAAEGLVDVEYRRLSGRTGPGSGRPAKLYRRADREVSVSLPERHYELAGELMASAIERSLETGQPVREALEHIADAAGRIRGARAESLPIALEENGFEPRADGEDVVFGNCPFHRLAQKHTTLVCALNHSLVRGLAEGVGDAEHSILPDPGAGRCCVRIRAAHPTERSPD